MFDAEPDLSLVGIDRVCFRWFENSISSPPLKVSAALQCMVVNVPELYCYRNDIFDFVLRHLHQR